MNKIKANNMEVKRINRNQIFRYVNKFEKVSKPDIALNLNISMPTVLQNVKELMEHGLICEEGAFESTGGRKAKVLSPLQNARWAIGIDITQNHVGFALTDLSGKVLRHTRMYKPFRSEDSYYKELGNLAHKFLEESNMDEETFLGFGISIPGIVTPDNKTITFSHVLGIKDVPCSSFSQFLNYPCYFINDANAAGLAEIYNAKNQSTAVYLSLSNSVGGTIIQPKNNFDETFQVSEKLYLGDNWRGGEFGHVTLIPGGEQCYCGKQGCFDVYCSAKKLSQKTEGKLEIFFEELQKGNREFEEMWEEYLGYLALEVNSLRMIFDCKIIIGGYVGSFIEPYLKRLQEKVALLNTFSKDETYIQPCRYQVEASALGAAILHIESFISSI
ncbi:ROK family transcriptional regulator [Anaerosacchariphilus polymeriproducens]|uniref:ROK family transcriptional regulator n=1 Tax=Anaerosacchariphilus polymeriproducens TaxID=1812858 RepID=A0A371ASM6_9FIRM|nr:ROK family transcriptional regulator [Anaerosacchariphilus polymeriproducens]RDU22561.1 ROK family transcriptional regulator [Anaerosacchariphilus polymeriproducens]